MSDPKNKKTIEEEVAARPQNTQEQKSADNKVAPTPNNKIKEKPKHRGCCIGVATALVLVAFLIVGIIGLKLLGFWFSPYFILDLWNKFKGTENSGQSRGGTLEGKDPWSITDSNATVSKSINAKNGGSVQVKTKNGLTATLLIPPGSLKKDTEITLAPNEEDPVEGLDPDPQDPGITIGPPGTNFNPPATVVFSYIPTQITASLIPGSGQGNENEENSNVPNLSQLLPGLGNLPLPGQSGSGNTNPDQRTTTPPEGSTDENSTSSSPPRFPDNSVLVFVNGSGQAGGIPTSRTDDGSGIQGPIDEAGSTAPQNPDSEGAQDLADDARVAAGGACTGEYIEALARMVAVASAEGNNTAVSRYESEIRRCNDESLDHLRRLCESSPIQLRRKDFQNRLGLAQALPASSQTASEIERLMNECQAKYHFHGEAIDPRSSNGVISFSSLDATVCGYLDDQWNGNQLYRLTAEGGSGSYVFEGTSQFNLPPNAGSFAGTTHGSNTLNVVGVGVATPQMDFGFTGYFDGNSRIQTLTLSPGSTMSGIPIELQEKPCIPLAPLPGGTN